MGWIVALFTVTSIAMLGFMLWRPEAEKGWQAEAEGLRERFERDGLPRP